MSEVKKVCIYPGGSVCKHCLWVSNNKDISEHYGTSFVKPYHIIRNGETEELKDEAADFQGLTVIDSHSIFRNSFNCIYGCEYGNCDIFHNYKNIPQLFRGITYFVEFMNDRDRNPITKCRFVLNSKFKKDDYGSKEHPHALLTVIEPKDFFKIEESFGNVPISNTRKRLQEVNFEPYREDVRVELNSNACYRLIRADDFIGTLNSILDSSRIVIRMEDDFYIFLTYEFINKKGRITGVVSTSKKNLRVSKRVEKTIFSSNIFDIISQQDEEGED